VILGLMDWEIQNPIGVSLAGMKLDLEKSVIQTGFDDVETYLC
jgi:hypothetical protein